MTEATVIETLEDLEALLAQVVTIAVVGLSPDPRRDSHTVTAYLQANGYHIVGVHPGANEVLGEPCYPSLSEIPEDVRRRIDLVAVFRRADAVPPIVAEAGRLGLRRMWFQIGVSSSASLALAARLGIQVVANKCLRVVHSLLRERIQRARGAQKAPRAEGAEGEESLEAIERGGPDRSAPMAPCSDCEQRGERATSLRRARESEDERTRSI